MSDLLGVLLFEAIALAIYLAAPRLGNWIVTLPDFLSWPHMTPAGWVTYLRTLAAVIALGVLTIVKWGWYVLAVVAAFLIAYHLWQRRTGGGRTEQALQPDASASVHNSEE